jgi:hydroxypyruvate isomerase
LSVDDLFRSASEIGYAAIELLDEDYFGLTKKYNLAISSHPAFDSLTQGLNHREYHQGILQEFEANLKLAEAWKIPNLICFSGNRVGISNEQGAEITAEGLRNMAPMAESAGVTLVLELLNSKIDHPDYQCDHTLWGVKVMKLVNSPNVKLLYDIYHMQIMEGDLIRSIQAYHPYIGHYHTAGNPGRNDIDDTQEIYYPAIFKSIKATAYSGYIAHEFVPRKDVKMSLKEAFEMCQSQ